MGVINWLQTWVPETPLRKVCNVRQQNRIANILNHLQGVNCRVIKPTTGEGRGWLIVVDGGSDIAPEESSTNWPKPSMTNSAFPYGSIWTCGIDISGANVTIYNAKLFEGPGAGVEVSNGDGNNNVQITVTTDPTYVAAKYVFATNTLTIENMGGNDPHPGYETGAWFRRLYKFGLNSDGNAYMARCLLFDHYLPGTWGQS